MASRRIIRAGILAFVMVLGGIGRLGPATGADSWVKNDLGMPFDKGQLFDVAAGDGDRDGSAEVYFSGQQAGGVYQYTYEAAKGAWVTENIAGQGFVAGAIVVGDGDDSGDKEIYVTGMNREPPRMRAAVYQFSYSVKGWQRVLVGTSGSAGNDMAIGDGNNDSRTELFTADSDGHIYSYSSSGNSWNTLDVGNSTPSQGPQGNPMESVAVGDGDNDGWPEVYGSSADGSLYRFAASGFGWSMSVANQGEFSKSGSDMPAIVIGDADGDGRNEIFGASFVNASIYMFKFDAASGSWAKTKLGSLGSGVRAMSLALGDGNSDGMPELYAGTSNNQVYKVFLDNATGLWHSASIGSGNGPINGVTVASAAGDASQNEVYAACQDGHAYQFVVDRTPPENPSVSSDTHPSPGTWYPANIVHVLWQDVGKDVSGIDGYSYSWDSSPSTVPDDRKEVEESVHDATSAALSPGKWYFHIRARDKALNWNGAASHFGPICIGTAPDNAPPQISNVQVSGITDKLAVVSWSTSEPADSVAEYGSGAAYGLKASDPLFALDHGLTLSGLTASTTYHIRVSSRDSSGNAATGEDLIFSTLAAPDTLPPAISNVRVSGITDRLAVVSWETDEPADSAVDYGLSTAYGQTVRDAGAVSLHELALNGLNASTVYHIRALSKDATGNGPAVSADMTFTTLGRPDTTPPALYGVRVEQVETDSAIVLWETDEVSDSFVDYGQTTAYGVSSADRTLLLYHSVLLKGLSPGTTYHYRALSADSSGNTGMGADLTFSTASGGSQADRTPPVISGVTASGISDTRAVIIWTTDELSDSTVEYGNGTAYGQQATDPSFSKTHSVVLDGLRPITVYHFRVMSADVFGNGPSVSADLILTTAGNPDSNGPVISNVKVAGITSNSATITWTTNEPSDSVVEYGNSTSYGQKLASKLNVLSHSVTVSGLSPGKTYHFRVQSTDPAGNGAAPAPDKAFTTQKSGGTAVAPLPWLWPVLGIFILALVVGGVLVWAYGRKPEPAAGPPVAAASGAAFAAPAAAAPEEAVETLEMDAGAPEASDGGWEEEGGTAAGTEPLPIAVAAAPAITAVEDRQAPGPVPVRHIRCPKCKARIPLYTEGPSRILCPNCGTTGEYRPKGSGVRGQRSWTATDLAGATARTATVAAPARAPGPAPMAAAPTPEQAAYPPTAAPARMTRCSNCGSPVPVYATSYPLKIVCPGCGKAGIYRGPRR